MCSCKPAGLLRLHFVVPAWTSALVESFLLLLLPISSFRDVRRQRFSSELGASDFFLCCCCTADACRGFTVPFPVDHLVEYNTLLLSSNLGSLQRRPRIYTTYRAVLLRKGQVNEKLSEGKTQWRKDPLKKRPSDGNPQWREDPANGKPSEGKTQLREDPVKGEGKTQRREDAAQGRPSEGQ